MKSILIRGWSDGVDTDPIVLLRVLRAGLQVDLQQGKTLIDEYAEQGRAVLQVPDEVAERLQILAEDAGLKLEVEPATGRDEA